LAAKRVASRSEKRKFSSSKRERLYTEGRRFDSDEGRAQRSFGAPIVPPGESPSALKRPPRGGFPLLRKREKGSS